MTFEIAEDAPERASAEAEALHELAVNEFGYHTQHVLFTAHEDGTISGRIALDVARDHHEYGPDPLRNTTHTGRDPDPDSLGVAARAETKRETSDAADATANLVGHIPDVAVRGVNVNGDSAHDSAENLGVATRQSSIDESSDAASGHTASRLKPRRTMSYHAQIEQYWY